MRASHFAVPLALALLTAPARADELDALGQAIEQHPDDPKSYDAYALAAFKAKRFDDAIHKLKVGVARIGDYGEGYYKLAYAYRQKKEWADAADYYRRYIALNPTKTDPYFGLGASLEGLGDKRGAIAAYDKYVSLEKSPAKQKFVDQAKAELVKLDPTRAPAPPPAPVAPPPAAVVATPSAVPVDPYRQAPPPAGPPHADAPALKAAAEGLRKEGKLEEAAAAYEKAVAADRGNVDLYNDLGNVYFALKRYSDAARAFRDATNRDPNYQLGWYNLAHALRKGGQKSEAVAAYRQYIRLRPDDPDPYYGLAQTLKALGDVAGAVDAFRKYINMEKRPDEQRWVDKARAELEQLEAMQRSAPSPSGKVMDDRSSNDDVLRRSIDRDRLMPLPPSVDEAVALGRLRDLHDPWPERGLDGLLDPFGPEVDLPPPGSSVRRQLRAYGAAVAEFRRALSRQVEDVTARYERGATAALGDDSIGAFRAWNAVHLNDAQVDAARRGVERLRSTLLSRR
jgi:tetratricopeptide (TPR) repeat protein